MKGRGGGGVKDQESMTHETMGGIYKRRALITRDILHSIVRLLSGDVSPITCLGHVTSRHYSRWDDPRLTRSLGHVVCVTWSYRKSAYMHWWLIPAHTCHITFF